MRQPGSHKQNFPLPASFRQRKTVLPPGAVSPRVRKGSVVLFTEALTQLVDRNPRCVSVSLSFVSLPSSFSLRAYSYTDYDRFILCAAVARCRGQRRGLGEPCYTSTRRSMCCSCKLGLSRWSRGAGALPLPLPRSASVPVGVSACPCFSLSVNARDKVYTCMAKSLCT